MTHLMLSAMGAFADFERSPRRTSTMMMNSRARRAELTSPVSRRPCISMRPTIVLDQVSCN